jgi:hypothetical protein
MCLQLKLQLQKLCKLCSYTIMYITCSNENFCFQQLTKIMLRAKEIFMKRDYQDKPKNI